MPDPMAPPISASSAASVSMSATTVVRRPPSARSTEMTERRWVIVMDIAV
ncbi:hypothetical protein H7H78_16275 [Mycobacterium shinjukuense]|nr:hypothetical protein [Mycobacterium shinjukuense]